MGWIFKNLKKKVSEYILFRIFLAYTTVIIFVAFLFYRLIPKLLNYAPGHDYIDALHGANYFWQFVMMVAVASIIGLLILIFCLKGLNKVEDYFSGNPTGEVPEEILNIKRKLLNLPYTIYIIQIAIPLIIVTLLMLPLFVVEKASLVVFFRVFFLLATFFTLISVLTLVLSRNLFRKLLLKYGASMSVDGIRITIVNKMFLQILPMFVIAVLFTSLIGYSNNVNEKGNLISEAYIAALEEAFTPYNGQLLNFEQIKDILYNIRHVTNIKDSSFIIKPDDEIFTSDGKELSGYFLLYLNELSFQNGGHVYDVTLENQGVIKVIPGTNGDYVVGIKFDITSESLIISYIISFIMILLFCTIVLYFLSKTMSDDIQAVTGRLSEITSDEYQSQDKRLPITSNDEISDLVIAFNKIQMLVQDNIREIQYNHDILIQQERLVSLGQLIGGIAHSLKTPISSSADTLICIDNLVNEYDESIDINTVTSEDHHAIAKEMKMHIQDLKEIIDYMNGIINTVKNHAADSEHLGNKFTIKELMNSINILMQNELKKNNCWLNITTNMNDEEIMYGDIRSLVQIINVLISNSIQAYLEGNGTIDISIEKDEKNIRISVKDYGEGIPENIQGKLLNKMVTTKGSKGTGIGLYISNSIIKAKFNGTMNFVSNEGFGSTFYINLPQRRVG